LRVGRFVYVIIVYRVCFNHQLQKNKLSMLLSDPTMLTKCVIIDAQPYTLLWNILIYN
jgi:hypothetical protein